MSCWYGSVLGLARLMFCAYLRGRTGNIPNGLIVGLGRNEIRQVVRLNFRILSGKFIAMRYIF